VNEPWEESRFECFELMDAGTDKVVADLRSEMRGKASGAGVAWRFWQVITFRNDGKALRFRMVQRPSRSARSRRD
jgi:hypothetical protein